MSLSIMSYIRPPRPSEVDHVGIWECVVALVTCKPRVGLLATTIHPGLVRAPGSSQSLVRDCLDRQWCLPAFNPCSEREHRGLAEFNKWKCLYNQDLPKCLFVLIWHFYSMFFFFFLHLPHQVLLTLHCLSWMLGHRENRTGNTFLFNMEALCF